MKYELVIRSTRRPSFVPHDLRYFDDHFICQSMANSWEIPPAEILGRSYKPADFVLWMNRAPIVSEKAKIALSSPCGELVEFLPFHSLYGKKFFAVNVLNMDRNLLIYKKDPKSAVFACERFGTIVRDNLLSGLEMADPTEDIDRKILNGESVNAFPGLVG
jgi:hypothetical protein